MTRVCQLLLCLCPLLLAGLACDSDGSAGNIQFEDQCDGGACDPATGNDAGTAPTDAARPDATSAGDALRPDSAQTDSLRLDTATTDVAQPDAARPDSASPDLLTADSAQPDRGLADGAQPDSAQPDSAQPDSAQPDSAQPDSARPDSSSLDATRPDTALLDSAQPDTALPDTSPPDNNLPDTLAEDHFDPCEGVYCGPAGHCEAGVCVCDNGYMAHASSGCTPFDVSDFTSTDLNPDSSTYNQSRSLSDELGKVVVIHYVLFT